MAKHIPRFTSLRERVVSQFFGALQTFGQPGKQGGTEQGAGEKHPSLEAISPKLNELGELRREAAKIRELLSAEQTKHTELQSELETAESSRLDALTEVRMTGNASHQEKADQLLATVESKRQELRDTGEIADRINAKLQAINADIEEAKRGCLIDVGKYLDGRMEALASRYSELAPEVAEHVLQIAALQKVMVQLGVGNSNGYWKDVRLPEIVAGSGKTHPPLLDPAGKDYDRDVVERMEDLLDHFRRFGLI